MERMTHIVMHLTICKTTFIFILGNECVPRDEITGLPGLVIFIVSVGQIMDWADIITVLMEACGIDSLDKL